MNENTGYSNFDLRFLGFKVLIFRFLMVFRLFGFLDPRRANVGFAASNNLWLCQNSY